MTEKPPPPQEIQVPPLAASQRLDQFLVQRFPHTGRAFWRKHLQDFIQVDGRKPTKGQRLQGGENIRLLRSLPESQEQIRPNPEIPLEVLYQDDCLIALNKPAGLPSLPKDGPDLQSLANALVARFPEQAQVDPEAGLIHRLDNATSGILLAARQPKIHAHLRQLSRGGEIQKEYLAWVEGKITEPGVVRLPIAHHPKNPRKMVVATDEKTATKLKARPAYTEYQPLKHQGRYTLLKLTLKKGARHQLRVHLASQGHPILGDPRYGTPGSSLLLHAHRLVFPHPQTGKKIELEAPIPKGFAPDD